MRPSATANPLLKHNKPQFYIGKTDLTRRILCEAGPYWALKSTLWAPSSLSLMHKNKQFQPHSGQKAVLMCFNALHCDFIAHIVLKSWNH